MGQEGINNSHLQLLWNAMKGVTEDTSDGSLRTQSQSSMLEQTVVSSGYKFSVSTAVMAKKNSRNELSITFFQTRMDDKVFSSYKWKHVLARPST